MFQRGECSMDKNEILYKVFELAKAIDLSYPKDKVKFNCCSTVNCHNSAITLHCANCAEDKLSEYVGAGLAFEYHESVRESLSVYIELCEKAEKRYEDEDVL